jgi:hypothetical protein
MALPTPTPAEVAEFKRLYEEDTGTGLTDEEAWEASTRMLRLFCLATYGEPGRDW